MILFEITGSEDAAPYQNLAISNGTRQYDFLNSVVLAALEVDRPFLSQSVIRALNAHAILCLHTNAGEYRPCKVSVGTIEPPEPHRVPALMDDFINLVNRIWETTDPVVLAALVLWRLNHIHPFINGNGRTARAACYFVLCLKAGGLLRGSPILPELIKQNHDEYVLALRAADEAFKTGSVDLAPLHALLDRLIGQQVMSADGAAAT